MSPKLANQNSDIVDQDNALLRVLLQVWLKANGKRKWNECGRKEFQQGHIFLYLYITNKILAKRKKYTSVYTADKEEKALNLAVRKCVFMLVWYTCVYKFMEKRKKEKDILVLL